MPLRVIKPKTSGQRGAVVLSGEGLSKKKPEKSLLTPLKRRGGRNSSGRITVRHRGGGSKRRLRVIDFKRGKAGVPGTVSSIEYDPNRTARIALIKYADGDWRYVLATNGMKEGDSLEAGGQAEIKPGNSLALKLIPTGIQVHNIELKPGRGGQMVRSAGTSAQILAKEGNYALLRLPSGEVRKVLSECVATIGQVGNPDHKNIKLGKAGRTRHIGRRPQVRGSAMSPRDHPHGGGEGRSPIGMPGPKTPWGKPALGYRTRHNKDTGKYIVRRRNK